MKTLLAILISVVGLNAYANWDVTNNSTAYLAVKCFPSGTICNGIGPGHDCGACPDDDTSVYFGRYGMSSSTATNDLDAVTVYASPMHHVSVVSGYHHLGDGNVWHITYNSDAGTYTNRSFAVSGDPTGSVLVGF